ncbi:hypothetical protein Br6_04974 [Rhodococcus sp. Br-6]|nr:hypothetical protein Br6_04974 [Rhodococcus sp. Br-6]
MPKTHTPPTSTIPDTIPANYRDDSPKPAWPWILASFVIVIGLLVAACVAVIASAKNNLAAQDIGEVTYEVSFDHPVQGGVLTTNIAVAYTDTDGHITQAAARTVPWRVTATPPSATRAAVTATNDATNQTIVCTIRAGDTVLATHTATGPHASATCTGATEID